MVNYSSKIVPADFFSSDEWLRIRAGRRVVLCHGVFDVVHPGHIDHFGEACILGDILVVSVSDDRWVNKGPGRPVFSVSRRAANLAALTLVDYVLVSDSRNGVETIRTVNPEIYFKGIDYATKKKTDHNLRDEITAVEEGGGEIVFGSTAKLSSTDLISKLNLADTRDPGSPAVSVRDALERAILSKKSVAIVGEIILDKYLHCRALGRTSKYPNVAMEVVYEEQHIGGTFAVAKNLASLGLTVHLFGNFLSGDEKKFVDSVSNLNFHPIESAGLPVTKLRYLHDSSGAHLFELYELLPSADDLGAAGLKESAFSELEFDAALIMDYGHGFMGPETIAFVKETLGESSTWTVANTQKNAGNQGINSPSKYSWSNAMIINGSELEAEIRSKGKSPEDLARQFFETIEASELVVTLGAKGCLALSARSGSLFSRATSSQHPKDRVGAGDAFIAGFVAGHLLELDLGERLSTANAAGFLATLELGNDFTLRWESILELLGGEASTDPPGISPS